RLKVETRGVLRWNAYLWYEAQRRNKDGDGANPLKAHELAASLKEKWNAMTYEEKVTLTDPLLEDLQKHREATSHGQRNVPLESFSDARQSLLQMTNYMMALNARTGTEMIIIASRTSSDSYLHPFATYTSPRALEFTFHQFKLTLSDLAS
ncbi:hypothetical protein C0993_002849, partial [Termitomyces sp. T159_Od127]